MKFLFVTDERFCVGPDGHGYTFYPHQFDYIPEKIPELTELTIWSRLVTDHPTDALFPCPNEVGRCRIRFVGPQRPIFKIGDWPMLFARNFFTLRREVRTSDVIFLKMPAKFPALALRFIRANQIVALYLIGNPRETIPIMLPYLKWIVPLVENSCTKAAQRANLASFVSNALLDEYGSLAKNPIVTNNCSIRRSQIVKDRRIEPGTPPVVTYLGRLTPEKGVLILLEAFALLTEKMDAHLDIIGEGPMRKEMEKRADDLAIADKTTMYGRVPPGDPFFAALRRSDVIVLPSLSEGTPSVIPEAMSQGLPIVASSVGGIPDILQNGQAGILVPPGDPKALAEAVARTFSDMNLRKKLINKSLELAVENCMENQAGRMFGGIASLIRNRT